MEMVLEEYEVYDPIPLVVGSSVGGLLLLALITVTLYKVSVFIQHFTAWSPSPPTDRIVCIAGKTQIIESGRPACTYWLCLTGEC